MTTLSASLAELGQCGLLKSADLIALEPFLRESPIESLAAGNVLIRAGQPNHQLYLVLSGRLRVHLSAGDATPFATVEAGETVGEVSLLDHQPASATVVADTESRVVVIDEEVLWTLIEHSHAVACNMLAALARRLRYGNVVLRRAEENSAYLATHDALTDLPNRALFEDRLTQALVHSRRASGLAAGAGLRSRSVQARQQRSGAHRRRSPAARDGETASGTGARRRHGGPARRR